MLMPSKKGQYALRAVYELARRQGQGPIKISAVAEAQAIPHRFLEVILHQLKSSGLVDAKRGYYGGYALAKPPVQITVGDVLRHIQKEPPPGQCVACGAQQSCPFIGRCAFALLWQRVKDAAFQIYDGTTLQDLLDDHAPVEALKAMGAA